MNLQWQKIHVKSISLVMIVAPWHNHGRPSSHQCRSLANMIAPRATIVARSHNHCCFLTQSLSLPCTTITTPWATRVTYTRNHYSWWQHEIFSHLFNIPFLLCISQDLLNLICILRQGSFTFSIFHLVISACLLKK